MNYNASQGEGQWEEVLPDSSLLSGSALVTTVGNLFPEGIGSI